MVWLRYFAWVREAVGQGEEHVDPPPGVATVAELLDVLAQADERHAAAFADRARLRCALDGSVAPLDAPLAGVRELAVFPPVTGG